MSDDLQTQLVNIVKQGREASPDFDDHSHFVVTMAKSPNELRQALAAIGDDAHRVVSHLADDPDAAADILNHTGQRLGAALGKIAAKLPPKAAAPQKDTPQPAAPTAPAATPTLYDSKLSTKEWAKEYDRQQVAKQQKRVDAAKADSELLKRRRAR
jgi:hypothetical protein